jgi:hypothetical protein
MSTPATSMAAALARVDELAADNADLRREVRVLTAERDAALYARDTAAAQKHSGGS